MTGKWNITDGEKPGEGEPVGFVESLATGEIHLQIDGYLSPDAADFARVHIMAAINDARGQKPGSS